jgi:RNA polymerase sigma-70 factor (ECF subfamily)
VEVASQLSGGAGRACVALVEGVAGLAWAPGGQLRGVAVFTIAEGKIVEIDAIGDHQRQFGWRTARR